MSALFLIDIVIAWWQKTNDHFKIVFLKLFFVSDLRYKMVFYLLSAWIDMVNDLDLKKLKCRTFFRFIFVASVVPICSNDLLSEH